MQKNRRIAHHRPYRNAARRRPASPRLILFLLVFLGIASVGSVFLFNFLSPDEIQSSIDRAALEMAARHEYHYADPIAEADPEPQDVEQEEELPVAEAPMEPEITRMTGFIQKGDTPSTLLEGHLSMAEIYSLCDESKDVYSLDNLKAGQSWTMIYSDNALVGLEYEIDADERLVVSMTDSGYEFRRESIPYDMEVVTVTGSIESSLFGAVLKQGENEDLAIRLASVFAYDVDFVRDLRTEDTFRVIIEKKFREGTFFDYGNLLAASFTNQGQTYYAYRYTDKKGNSAYYDQTGRPLRKAFLKSPLPFTRISSGYSMSRMHPILKYRRPHQGIDYAAPTGTPISSVADGLIAEVGSNNSQGRYVRVTHSNGLETIYNHMSKFSANSKKGAKVKQGAVIGYVGSTGYATGPHLDFRMRQNGQFINPLKLKSLPAEPVPAREMPNFRATIANFKAKLEEPIRAASLDTSAKPRQ